MRIEPTKRESDPVALAAVICGVAPIGLAVFSILPFFGLLATPLIGLSVLAAIICGVVGVVRAKQQPEPNYVLPLTGIVLGVFWIMLLVGIVVFFTHHAG